MRRRLAALLLGLRRSPFGAVGALSGLTVRESVRRKVFIVLVVFAIVMLGASALLPSIRPEDRVALIEAWAQRSITFFGVLIAVFLAGVCIPDDIEERRVYTLLTKPLSRWQLLVGRFFGFATLLAGFAVAAFVMCAIFVRVVAHDSPGLLASRTEFAAAGMHIEEKDSKSRVEARYTPVDPLIGTITGDGLTVAFWGFRGLDMDDLPDVVTAKINIEVQGTSMLTFGEVEIMLKPTTTDVPAAEAAALGWTVDFVSPPKPGEPLPIRIATRRLIAKQLIPFEIQIPRGWFGTNGSLDIAVVRGKPNLILSVRPTSVVIRSKPHNFEWNFAKALASTYLLWMVVLGLTIAGSTVLSGPVNLLFGIAVFVSGSMVGFVRESLPTVQERIQLAETAEKEEAADHDHHDIGGDDFPVFVLRFSQAVSRISLRLIPDLNTFDASTPILRGIDIPAERLADGGKFAFAYVLGALVVGLGFLRMREFR